MLRLLLLFAIMKKKIHRMTKRTRYLFLIIDAIDVVMEKYSITKLKIISNVNKDCLHPICKCAFISIPSAFVS